MANANLTPSRDVAEITRVDLADDADNNPCDIYVMSNDEDDEDDGNEGEDVRYNAHHTLAEDHNGVNRGPSADD